MIDSNTGATHLGQTVSMASSPQLSSGPSSMDLVPLANKPILEKKASVYAEVVKKLNDARERGLPFKVNMVIAF
jgi:nuclear pore complex protein Nup93